MQIVNETISSVPAIEATQTTRPWDSRSSGKKAFVTLTVPIVLTSIIFNMKIILFKPFSSD